MKQSIRRAFLLASALLPFLLCRSCHQLLTNAEQEIFTSPQGTNTVIIQYDLVCRPAVYQKGLLWNKKIWDYPGSGFMETVHFGVEWLSETEIRLTYDDINDEYDEEYIIALPAGR